MSSSPPVPSPPPDLSKAIQNPPLGGVPDTFHMNTLLNYLPIIVLAIILLIGFVSWDIMKGNWPIFVTLILTFLYVLYVHYLSPKKFIDMKNSDKASPFLPSAPDASFIWGNGLFENIIRFGVPVFLFVIGLGMGFGSIPASEKISNNDLTRSMITIGSILLIGGFVISIYKRFVQNKPISEWIHYVVISIIIGIPLIVRGNEINNNMDKVNDDPLMSQENKTKFSKDSADLILGFGLFFQIAFFIAVGYFIWRNTNAKSGLFGDIKSRSLMSLLMAVVIGIPSILFIAASQKTPGFNESLSEYGTKSFLVHGIVWLIAFIGFIVTLFGQLTQYDVHKFMLPVSCVILLVVGYIVFPSIFATENNKGPSSEDILKLDDNEYANSGYYKQLKEEVIKELRQKDPNVDPDGTAVTEAIQARLDQDKMKSQVPINAVLGTFSGLSAVIAIFILVCYNIRLKMADCGYIPDSFGEWAKDAFLYTTKSDCNGVSSTLEEKQEKIKQDKMVSNDWDKILTDNPDKSGLAVRFAKWFSFIPFLSVIMLVMWVSALFTNVTTSPKTSDWIASKFTGDMFPRVKELVDTFFIVIIVGLLLCGILLLPFVKEMNVGGLSSILNFAESVQVWQFNKNDKSNSFSGALAILGFIIVCSVGLSWWWKYLNETRKGDASLPIVPQNLGWVIAIVILLAICVMPTFYNFNGNGVHPDFAGENVIKRAIRQILTTIYLVPFLIIVLFRAGVYSIASLTGVDEFAKKRNETLNLLKFWEWDAEKTDLRMFPVDATSKPTPASVTSVPSGASSAATLATATAATTAATATAPINETKVGALGQLIKVILLTISFVIIILAVVYYVYKIDSEFVSKGANSSSTETGGIITQLNSPTAHTIYVLMAIVGIAGLIAYLRDKFTKVNDKTPENYLFDDLKTEDSKNPLRQLAFGATHLIYIILMVIVWIYDRDKDDKERMSVIGMTVLGLAILLFHFGLEFIDTLNPSKNAASASSSGSAETKPSVSDLFSNVRFMINIVFLIVLCALSYYKLHGVMVVLIVFMFFFHLTKSFLGLKVLKLLWLGIIFIPCLFLDLVKSSQSVVGDTTRPIWIIIAIEILLIAILYGGPYLLNYIGASASQIVAAPVSLKQKYDTKLNTQSPQIFIYHNTGIDRSPEDKIANCPVEEKKRYNYSISGWFFLNNAVVTSNNDLEIFNFGDVPRLTYNKSTTELKLWCNTLDMSGSPSASPTLIYNSRTNYNTIMSGKSKDKQNQIRMLVDNEDELDVSIPLQKWNYFVVNYNGKTMDFFLNTKLLIKSDFIMPDILMKPITVGDTTNNKGLNGSVCNFAFHKVPLTKEQMRWTYTMLKSRNPPMIGMKTIEDEVKEAGTTTVYAK